MTAAEIIRDTTKPIDERIRALHVVRELPNKEEASDAIAAALEVTQRDEVLLMHEFAYVMGQVGQSRALPILRKLLHDESQHVVTRHECAEAMGAIGDIDVTEDLKKYLTDDCPQELRETAHLSLSRFEYYKQHPELERVPKGSSHLSVDPAPPLPGDRSVEELRNILLDAKEDIFVRYQAMFSLRNLGAKKDKAALSAICDGLKDPSSALFRHECAFVLGQLEDPSTQDALIECVENATEHGMVRHEAAEALGGIADPKCLDTLRAYAKDEERLLKDSCVVALDMYEYWSKFKDSGEGGVEAAHEDA